VARNLDDILQSLPPARQEKIAARSKELRQEYETLQELRKALNVTQVQLARGLGVKQENVSRLEKRQDMLLSTLARTIAALGGRLDVIVRFDNNPPVSLSKLVEAASQIPSAGRGASRPPGRPRTARRRAAVRT
jgi:transcriptional regulator with XRE-family HTH domain